MRNLFDYGSLSEPRNKSRMIILVAVSGLLAIVAVVLGIDDNPPGLLAAFTAAISFVLAFSLHWRTTKQFGVLLLASVAGFVLFIILNIVSDSIAQNPAAAGRLQNLINSSAYEALNLIFAMICPAAFIVGAVGSVAMFIRRRRHQL